MISIKDIEKYFPENQRAFKKNILREYLQHKILQIIFNTAVSKKLSFMGGTCLRIVYGTNRFSEDLDFDNFSLSGNEFNEMSLIVKKELELEGYTVGIKNVLKTAFRCYIRIPKLLFENKLSGFEEEKILIQLDTESQGFDYENESILLNKFDIFTNIFITPKEILLSQKLWAILNRKVLKGRDFYDTTFLYGLAKPDFNYLTYKAGIKNQEQLKAKILARLEGVDMKLLASDVSPFLINKADTQRILNFKEFVRNNL